MAIFNHISLDTAKELLINPTPKEIIESYNEHYSISELEISSYTNNGFIHLSSVIKEDTLLYLRNVIQAAVLVRKGSDERLLKDKSQYEQSFLQCGYICWDYNPVKDFVFGKRFAGIARDLMKVNSTRLWHDQALFKEAGGRKTDVHQDSSYWPVANPELTTTMWLALNDVNEENGCLYFYPGSHHKQREYVDIFKNPHKPELLNGIDPVNVPLKAGDATFHSGLTYHGANENKSKVMREGMTVIFIADGSKFNSNDKRNATHKSCEALQHGEEIDTKYTPKLI